MIEPNAIIVRAEVHIIGIQPKVARTLELPLDLNLAQLHEALQATFAWTDSHLHQFDIGGLTYGAPEFDQDGWSDRQIFDASNVRLADFTISYDAPILVFYEYDFGDSWEHVPVDRFGRLDPEEMAELRRSQPILPDSSVAF